jgi:hypothetical protein
MKEKLIAATLFIAISGGMLISVGCQPPGISQSTIEINYVNTSGCPVTVNVDGNDTVNFSAPDFYTYPNTFKPGNHTLNFTTGGTCVSNPCVFPNSSSSYSLNFNVGAGEVYEASVSEDTPNCNNILVSGS